MRWLTTHSPTAGRNWGLPFHAEGDPQHFRRIGTCLKPRSRLPAGQGRFTILAVFQSRFTKWNIRPRARQSWLIVFGNCFLRSQFESTATGDSITGPGPFSFICIQRADIPVIQLSIDETRESSWHYEVAKQLQSLRDEGVLILGSGNIVHNLHTYSWGNRAAGPYDWALRFENQARELLRAGRFSPLVAYEGMGRDAHLSVPTPDHYLPLVYVLAQHREGDAVSFPVEGFDGGSISMLAVQVG